MRERIREIAGELIATAALRALRAGDVAEPDSQHYAEFVNRFPYQETDDQERAIAEVIEQYNELGRFYTHVCALYATAALTTAAHVQRGQAALAADATLTAVLPVLRFSFPIQRALVQRGGRLALLQPEHYHTRSQDLEPAYHDAGQWYWLRTDKFVQSRELMGPNSTGLLLSEMEAQDIDNEDDWAIAELKYELRQQRVLV
jgi:N-acylneuraminate cytidylyltransferase